MNRIVTHGRSNRVKLLDNGKARTSVVTPATTPVFRLADVQVRRGLTLGSQPYKYIREVE